MKKLYYVITRHGNDGEVIYTGCDREQARDALENEFEEMRDPRYNKMDGAAWCEVYDVPDDTDEEQQYILDDGQTAESEFEINEMWYILDEIDDEDYGLIEYSDDRKIFGKGYTAEDLYHDSDIATYGGRDKYRNGEIVYQTFLYKDNDDNEHMVTARRLGPTTYPRER